jgi:ribosomal small subunit protein bTHX
MGKGDRKTKKGKIQKGTYGVRRPKKKSMPIAATETKKKKAAAPKTKKPAAKKPAAKKAAKEKAEEAAE